MVDAVFARWGGWAFNIKPTKIVKWPAFSGVYLGEPVRGIVPDGRGWRIVFTYWESPEVTAVRRPYRDAWNWSTWGFYTENLTDTFPFTTDLSFETGIWPVFVP